MHRTENCPDLKPFMACAQVLRRLLQYPAAVRRIVTSSVVTSYGPFPVPAPLFRFGVCKVCFDRELPTQVLVQRVRSRCRASRF